ncbi:MAG TPA: methylated-DNA--[protein]-cysteine S-methyltransferase [Calditrichia bacterium]|nr:methylated-DNA--[protein]-cysteine S-methyltransferase [Calditrichota bacterium]HQU72853.1 methylated-DNA--[protein]-cysteine S-methyltransferase [Calditrichia bacterium]HQV32047.1 methylated-DNA--[protein]-cysteine S-methyltransferase [Calditrichia bacterium]
MKTQTHTQQSLDYQRIARAIRYISENFREQPDLAEIAAEVNLSPFHFQRMFKRWAGTSPGRFLQFTTLAYARNRLRQGNSLLDTAYDAGLSGPGRLHDLFVQISGLSPGEDKQLGEGIELRFGIHDTPFGLCLLAKTVRGICALRFLESQDEEEAAAILRAEWPRATLVPDSAETEPLVAGLFNRDNSAEHSNPALHLRGTNFQVQVWQALLDIPYGTLVSYGAVARAIGKPNAHRAVAKAIGANPIAFLIPCHRVIHSTGVVEGYRWGSDRKKALIGWEALEVG